MVESVRFSRSFWLPFATGIAWFLCGEGNGFLAFAYSLTPGFLCLAAAFHGLSESEEKRATSLAALGGLLGVVLGLFSPLFFGLGAGVVVVGLSAWTAIDAGSAAAKTLESVEGVPAADTSLGFAAQIAIDEGLLGAISFMAPLPSKGDAARIAREVEAARELYEARGWLEKPEEFHRAPLSLDVPTIRSSSVMARGGRLRFESLSFESEYEPWDDEPGRNRWLDYAPNRTAYAHVLRHEGEPRPWIVCVHGYQMGAPIEDFGAFDPRQIHERYGYNMLLPTLPLHGPRKIGRWSGDGFLSGDVLDSVHAETQGLWDIRRLVSWVRGQDAPSIGVYGLSLGGFTASNLVGIESGFDFVLAGIPMTDFAGTFWRHLPDHAVRNFLEVGLTEQSVRDVTQVVSPMAMTPKVPRDGRAIFGAVGDRLVPAAQVQALVEHWEEPDTRWYQGSHLTFFFDNGVRGLIESTLERTAPTAG